MNVSEEGVFWRHSLVWLLFLAPLFFLSYGAANHWASARGVTREIAFAWERQIPFLPWTIVPYWSIDLLYGLSFLLCRTRHAVDTLAKRLLTAQIVATTCFVFFPLRFSWERPVVEGVFAPLFDFLQNFDQPFNQAPSLHIAILVILWARFSDSTQGIFRGLTHLWAALIALSVLTTYQHHFFDLPTGALLGFFCLACWPEGKEGQKMPSVWALWHLSACPIRRRLAKRYVAAAVLCALLTWPGGGFLWLWWPAVSLAVVGLIYLGLGPEGFQKTHGQLALASRVLLAPYLAGAWMNTRLWTRTHPNPVEIVPGLWLGRLPSPRERDRWAASLDLTAEFSLPSLPSRAFHAEQNAHPRERANVNLPCLDLVPLSTDALRQAAQIIERLRHKGDLLVFCALGYSRSAAAMAAWLLMGKEASSVNEALEKLAAQRPQLVFSEAQKTALHALMRLNDQGVEGAFR